MDEFLSDEEQSERTKKWLREFGPFVVAGVVLGLGGLFGYQTWDRARDEDRVIASGIYEQLNAAIRGERFNEVEETLELLENDYGWTPYLDQARLAAATMYVEQNQPDEALELLAGVIAESDDAELARVAELRSAQILIYLERYDEALTRLGTRDDSAYAALFHDLRGDALFAQGQLEAARDEYQLALDLERFGTIDRAYVQMKLDDVTGSISLAAREADEAESP